MPVSVNTELVNLSQSEFADVAYTVMGEVFALHRELGRLFDEKVYQNALVERLENVQSEVKIDVSLRDFSKPYFMDMIVANGGVFELKAVDCLNDGHQSQLLNYLLLTGLQHGKLVNFRTETVEHEFVNTSLTHEERTKFEVVDSRWQATDGFSLKDKTLIVEMLRDWGTCLSKGLYDEALIHFSGGPEKVLTEIDVCLDQGPVAKQTVALCAERIALRLTTFENEGNGYRKNLFQFLSRTELDAIQWINIARNQLTFETLR